MATPSERAPGAQPEALLQLLTSTSGPVPPTYTPDFVGELWDAGINGIGVATAIFDSRGRLLIGEHKVTEHNKRASWGPITETVRASDTTIEPTLATAWRGLHEELDIDPAELGLRHYGAAPFTLSMWHRPGQKILAITIPFFMPDRSRNRLLVVSPDTAEIGRVDFVPPAELLERQDLRDGTNGWLRHLGQLGLFETQARGNRVKFPSVISDETMHDLDDSRLGKLIALPKR